MVVVDTDVISYFWIRIRRTEAARRTRRRDADWRAPYLWRSEFRNVLRKYLNGDHLTLRQALAYAHHAERDLHGCEYHVAVSDVLKLAKATGHSAYDCEYVALAQALDVKLVTGDRALPELFPDTAVLLEDFAASKG